MKAFATFIQLKISALHISVEVESGRANCVGTNLACLTNRTGLCNLYPSNSIQVLLLLTTELEKNCKQMSKLSIKEGRIS